MPGERKPTILISSAVYEIRELLEQVFAILNTAGFTVWMSHKGTVRSIHRGQILRIAWLPSTRVTCFLAS